MRESQSRRPRLTCPDLYSESSTSNPLYLPSGYGGFYTTRFRSYGYLSQNCTVGATSVPKKKKKLLQNNNADDVFGVSVDDARC